MRILLSIPPALILYSEWHEVEPDEYAQFILDEKGREVAFWLIEEARASESYPNPRRLAAQGLS